jgi:hypothetical protein
MIARFTPAHAALGDTPLVQLYAYGDAKLYLLQDGTAWPLGNAPRCNRLVVDTTEVERSGAYQADPTDANQHTHITFSSGRGLQRALCIAEALVYGDVARLVPEDHCVTLALGRHHNAVAVGATCLEWGLARNDHTRTVRVLSPEEVASSRAAMFGDDDGTHANAEVCLDPTVAS